MNHSPSATIDLQPTTTATAPRRRRRLVGADLAVIAVFAALLAGAGPASAYTLSSYGYPGSTSTPATWASWTSYGTGQVLVPWRQVTESPRYANYAQYVCVQANYEEASGGGWIDADSQTHCAWIPAASTSANVNGAVFDAMGFNSFIYSVNVVVTWRLSNGALVGQRTYDYNALGDYRCSTAHCRVGMTTWGGGAFVEIDG